MDVLTSDSFEEFVEKKKNFKWEAESVVKGKSTVVVILGESTRGNHMSINGYSRKSTPLLENQKLINFSNAISNGVHTLVGTPFILTRKPLENRYIYTAYPEKSFISAYKEAGYKTYYISYEKNVVEGDRVINQYINEADEYIWRPSEPDHNEDSNGIGIISDILKKTDTEKNLIVYKLAGSHINYHDRYPMRFDLFQPSFKTVPFVNLTIDKKDVFVNTYDNTILHTDYVVSSIIDKLKECQGEAMLTFISDHGATLFEDGRSCGYSYHASQYNIPYFFWFNDACYDRLGKDNIEVLCSNEDKPVDQTYFIDSLYDASGIVTPNRVGKTLFEKLDDVDDRMVIVSYKFVPYIMLSDK